MRRTAFRCHCPAVCRFAASHLHTFRPAVPCDTSHHPIIHLPIFTSWYASPWCLSPRRTSSPSRPSRPRRTARRGVRFRVGAWSGGAPPRACARPPPPPAPLTPASSAGRGAAAGGKLPARRQDREPRERRERHWNCATTHPHQPSPTLTNLRIDHETGDRAAVRRAHASASARPPPLPPPPPPPLPRPAAAARAVAVVPTSTSCALLPLVAAGGIHQRRLALRDRRRLRRLRRRRLRRAKASGRKPHHCHGRRRQREQREGKERPADAGTHGRGGGTRQASLERAVGEPSESR
jgi:hypothetical protein